MDQNKLNERHHGQHPHSPIISNSHPIKLSSDSGWIELKERIKKNARASLGDSLVDKYGSQQILHDMEKLTGSLNSQTHNLWLPLKELQKETIKAEQGGSESVLSGEGLPLHFRVHKLDVTSYMHFKKWREWCMAIIVGGAGTLAWSGKLKDVQVHEQWFIPAGLRTMEWINTGEELLEIVICFSQK